MKLEYEPAVWPFDETAIERFPERVTGWTDLLNLLATEPVVRIRVPEGVSPRVVIRRLHEVFRVSFSRVGWSIMARRSGDYVYVRRVE